MYNIWMFIYAQDEFTKRVLEIIACYEPSENDSGSDGEKENSAMEVEVKLNGSKCMHALYPAV